MSDPVTYLDGLLTGLTDSFNPNGDGEHLPIELIDWDTIHDHGDELIDGFLIPGRWTAIAAGAKAGKTTLWMWLTTQIAAGHDPIHNVTREPVTVLYVDGEMGRLDLEQRLAELGIHEPANLTHWHATDLPPRLDTIPGGAALQLTVDQIGAQVVIIDGLNGVVSGAEKDDTTWRNLFDYTIMPLKRKGIAVGSGDNLGKDETLGPRGSSVKMDKADAIIRLKPTDDGVKLTTTHRRTAQYPKERLMSMEGLDGQTIIRYHPAAYAWAKGTAALAREIDALGLDTVASVRDAGAALRGSGHTCTNAVLRDAVKYRKLRSTTFHFAGDGEEF